MRRGPGRVRSLTAFGTCRIYRLRPVICRLWGVADALRCLHGCRPADGWISDAQALEYLLQAYEIDASSSTSPWAQPLLRALLRGDWSDAHHLIALARGNRQHRHSP